MSDSALDDAKSQIRNAVLQNDVVLFMKGVASQPMCGFSSQVVQILDHLGVEYQDVNVLGR